MPVLLDSSSKYITLGNASMPGTGFMILWVYTTNWDAAGNAAGRAIMDQSNNGSIRNMVYVHSTNDTYTGWNLGQIITDFSTADLEQETWTPILLTWDDAANEEHLYVNDLTTPFASRTAGFSAQTLTGTMQIGRVLSTGYDLDAYVAQFARGSTVPSADQRALLKYAGANLVPGLTITQHVPLFGDASSSDGGVATVGTGATLVGSAAFAGGMPSVVTYPIGAFQNAIAAALTAANASLVADGIEVLPSYDMFTSEGLTDWPSEFVKPAPNATTGTWTQSVADGRFTTRAVDGVNSGNTLLTLAEDNYDSQFGGSIPAYDTTNVNHPANHARDAYGFVFGAAFTYTQGRVFGDNSLSGKIGNWSTGTWPGGADSDLVWAGPGGRVSWPGKYPSSVTDLWEVLVVDSYHEPWTGLIADGSFSDHAQAPTRANYLTDFGAQYAGATDAETGWRLAGPVGAAHCASVLTAYPSKEYWPSYSRSSLVISDPAGASLEAEIFADNLTQIEAAGATGLWMFDENYTDANAFGAATRDWMLEFVQRYNQTGPYVPSTGGTPPAIVFFLLR